MSDMTRASNSCPRRTLPKRLRLRQTGRSRNVAPAANAPLRCASCSSLRIDSATPCCPLACSTICCATHPDARFTVVCGPVAEGVFARMPNRERTIVLDKRPYRLHWPGLWFAAATTLWDLVVDIRGSAFAWMVPTRRRAVMRRRPGHKIAQLAAMLRLDPPPLPVVWTAPQDRPVPLHCFPRIGPSWRWRRPPTGRRRYGRRSDSPRCSTRCAMVLLPGAIPAIFAGPGQVEREMAAPLLHSLPDAIDLTGSPQRAGSRRVPGARGVVRRQRFRPDASGGRCRGPDARPVRSDRCSRIRPVRPARRGNSRRDTADAGSDRGTGACGRDGAACEPIEAVYIRNTPFPSLCLSAVVGSPAAQEGIQSVLVDIETAFGQSLPQSVSVTRSAALRAQRAPDSRAAIPVAGFRGRQHSWQRNSSIHSLLNTVYVTRYMPVKRFRTTKRALKREKPNPYPQIDSARAGGQSLDLRTAHVRECQQQVRGCRVLVGRYDGCPLF